MFSLYDNCAKYFELNAGHYLNTTKYFVILDPKIMQMNENKYSILHSANVTNKISVNVSLKVPVY